MLACAREIKQVKCKFIRKIEQKIIDFTSCFLA